MNATYTAIRVEHEYNAEQWWDALREAYPVFAASLTSDSVAVIAAPLWDALAALPGFDGGPEYAPTALIDCGSGGDHWSDVVARRHSVFETLS
jgi:hypothetical protein